MIGLARVHRGLDLAGTVSTSISLRRPAVFVRSRFAAFARIAHPTGCRYNCILSELVLPEQAMLEIMDPAADS